MAISPALRGISLILALLDKRLQTLKGERILLGLRT